MIKEKFLIFFLDSLTFSLESSTNLNFLRYLNGFVSSKLLGKKSYKRLSAYFEMNLSKKLDDFSEEVGSPIEN